MLTLSPRASRMAPKEAAAMPFPNEETTPPVTQINRVIAGTVAVRWERRALHRAGRAAALRDGRSVYRKSFREKRRIASRAHEFSGASGGVRFHALQNHPDSAHEHD